MCDKRKFYASRNALFFHFSHFQTRGQPNDQIREFQAHLATNNHHNKLKHKRIQARTNNIQKRTI